jgi:hypothetical protein
MRSLCDNGKLFDSKFKKALDMTAYGDIEGCRDMSHLQNHGKCLFHPTHNKYNSVRTVPKSHNKYNSVRTVPKSHNKYNSVRTVPKSHNKYNSVRTVPKSQLF